jgi:hypothetical protein
LGIRHGYYHEDPMVCWKIDSIIDYMEDKQGAHVAIYAPLLGGAAFDESMAGEWFTKFWDVVIPVLDARLVEHGERFLAGTQRPTIADFKAFQTVFMNLESNRGCALSAQLLNRVKTRMQASPAYWRWVQNMEQECSGYIQSRTPAPF